MANRTFWTGILLGVIFGLILGVEVIHLAEERVCPHPACVDKASVIPVSDRGYFEAAHKALSEAKTSIHIASFEVKYYENFPNSSMNILVEDLIAAHNRGVEVKVVVDEYSNENNAFARLRDAGIEIKYDSEEVTTHAKLIIVDGKIVILGSTNLSFYGIEKNNEVNVVIRDEETARYYENYFQNIWELT
ncbi:MAG: phospholipase D-like domain-containing protein [Methanobacteriota archaeon]